MGRPKKARNVISDKKEVTMTEENKIESLETEDVNNEDSEDIEKTQSELDLVRIDLELAKKELREMQLKKTEPQYKPKREIDHEEKAAIDRINSRRSQSNGLKAKIEKQKEYDSVLVTGKFINRRVPGRSEKLPYHKYETDPIKWHTLVDGKVYTIPRGFADQINGGSEEDPMYYTPRFIQKQGEVIISDTVGENSSIAEVDTSNKKYSFVPINF